jgi:hypothetical protein
MDAPCAEAVGFDTLCDGHKLAQKDHLEEAVCAVLEDKDVRSIEIPCQIKPSLTWTSRSSLTSPRPQASGHSEIDMSYGFSEFAVHMVNVATEFRQIQWGQSLDRRVINLTKPSR